MKGTLIFLFLVLLLLVGTSIYKGKEVFYSGVSSTITEGKQLLFLFLIIIVISGFSKTLIPDNLIQNWLGEASGMKGIIIAWIAGILSPGGSMVGLPLIAVLYKAGAGLAVLMTFATSLALLSAVKIPLEIAIYGIKLTVIRLSLSLFLPLLVGLFTHLLVNLKTN